MYDAFPDLPAIYDSVPAYVARRDVQFYVEEATGVRGSVHLLARAGFRVRSFYGDFDRSALTDGSPEQIVCAERFTKVAT